MSSKKKSRAITPKQNALLKSRSKTPQRNDTANEQMLSNTSYLDMETINENNNYEEYLRQLFENRITSLMQIRARTQEVVEFQKQEEIIFIEVLKELLKHNTVTRNDSGSRSKIEELEQKLKHEYQEKKNAQKMFATFREEGGTIINRLRQSLTQVTKKYKSERQMVANLNSKLYEYEEIVQQEREKNEKLSEMYDQVLEALRTSEEYNRGNSNGQDQSELEAKNSQLRKQLQRAKRELKSLKGNVSGATSGRSENDSEEDTHWDSMEINRLKGKVRSEKNLRMQTEKVVEEKFVEFQRLVEEEETVIEKLKAKLSKSESENEKLKSKLSAKQVAYSEDGNHIPTEYLELYTEIKNLLDPEDGRLLNDNENADPHEKLNAQQRLIKLLLAKLKAEEQERLKTEEQSAEMVAKEEKTIIFLEKKLRALESMVSKQKTDTTTERKNLKRVNSRGNSPVASPINGFSPRDNLLTNIPNIPTILAEDEEEIHLLNLEKQLETLTQDIVNATRGFDEELNEDIIIHQTTTTQETKVERKSMTPISPRSPRTPRRGKETNVSEEKMIEPREEREEIDKA